MIASEALLFTCDSQDQHFVESIGDQFCYIVSLDKTDNIPSIFGQHPLRKHPVQVVVPIIAAHFTSLRLAP